jgi:TetR/AcrR family transcriptional repressor of mexJK operon
VNAVTPIQRPRAGRPTREQAEARQLELLDRALDHFLDKGYEQATIEAIAADVGMTKRTVYARYPEKRLLFLAAVSRAVDRYAVPDEAIRGCETDDLEQTLVHIATLRIDLVATPQGQKLQRIVNTESYRFPEIFTEMYERGALPSVRFLADVLDRAAATGELAIEDPEAYANAFMSLVVTGPVRFILAANPLPPAEIEERVRFGVTLFLNGARTRG